MQEVMITHGFHRHSSPAAWLQEQRLGTPISQIPLPSSEQGMVWGIPPHCSWSMLHLTASPLPPALWIDCHRGDLGLCYDNFVRGEKGLQFGFCADG